MLILGFEFICLYINNFSGYYIDYGVSFYGDVRWCIKNNIE